ncbi:MAG: hypothetical protein K2H43_03180 [Clostridia bacterium]|nr:hypothetical protein [Clostridia bacterium]
MVGKIMKYEFQAIFRALLYTSVVALGLSCIARIMMAIPAAQTSAIIFSALAFFAACAVSVTAFVVSIGRFWQSLFKGEGYMTFSLPVSTTKLLLAKLISAILTMFVGVGVAYVSLIIISSGFSGEWWESIIDFLKLFFNFYGSLLASDPLLIVEMIVSSIVAIPMTLLLVFLAQSLGQLSTNHRVGKTFAIVIGLVIGLSLLEGLCFDPILAATAEVNLHLRNWLQIIVYAGVDVGSFFLIRYILSRKLNLVI